MNVRDFELRLISELIKNNRKSDRALAKILGVSQPTVTRNRKKIEEEGLLEYLAVPDLGRLDFELVAFTFGSWNGKSASTNAKEANSFIEKNSNVIFASMGSASFGDSMIVSLHSNYSEYAQYIREIRSVINNPTTFIVSLKSDNTLKKLAFNSLIKRLQEKT